VIIYTCPWGVLIIESFDPEINAFGVVMLEHGLGNEATHFLRKVGESQTA